MLQIVSEALDVHINTVHLLESATNLVINSTTTAGSTGSDLNGYAVHNACKTLAERLKPYHEKMPDKSFEEIVKAAYHDRVNLSANGFYKAPNVDVGQIEGGFIQGVGWCTNEQTLHFPNGNLDIPQDFRIYTYEGAKTNVKSIHSSKGIGEPPLLLGNTVFFAIRDAITAARLPATPERIRIACDDKIVRKCKVEKKDGEVPWKNVVVNSRTFAREEMKNDHGSEEHRSSDAKVAQRPLDLR
ncbi:4470_t:CDS:2 [Dentiscutata erythropus]|uniref:4470_t:CDS:1 n=1 Tax=Dentiscutata erythropus TaxID=1348616 RepID=A0A9N9DY59_9GLOM|nr:4470_t:CDS:2 [Dentiscutata erythropus]